jgi:hypothetical protein
MSELFVSCVFSALVGFSLCLAAWVWRDRVAREEAEARWEASGDRPYNSYGDLEAPALLREEKEDGGNPYGFHQR